MSTSLFGSPNAGVSLRIYNDAYNIFTTAPTFAGNRVYMKGLVTRLGDAYENLDPDQRKEAYEELVNTFKEHVRQTGQLEAYEVPVNAYEVLVKEHVHKYGKLEDTRSW